MLKDTQPQQVFTKEEVRDIAITIAMEVAKSNPVLSCCNSAQCKEVCGLNHNEHFEAHRRQAEFFEMLSETGRGFRGLALKAVMGLIIGAVMIGLGIKIDKFF